MGDDNETIYSISLAFENFVADYTNLKEDVKISTHFYPCIG